METAAQPTVFSFQFHNSAEHKIRTLLHEDGSIWFVAKDACEILEMGTEQIRRLDDDEKGLRKVPTPGGKQSLAVINESGLYTLVLRSNKPQAKPFRKWITAEVLPTIRKTGSYSFVTQSQGPATSKEVVA
ncbi:BRO-N domain-containing protein, partial [Desulfuromonas thiophila]